jgi:RNA polymerase sigma factor (sigma-70 family)
MLPGYTEASSIHGQPFRRDGGAGAVRAACVMTEAVQTDPLLLPYARASEGAECERLLAALITEHAEPIVTRVVGYKMRAGRDGGGRAEAEDVRGEVMLQLVQRLHNFRADHAARPIRDFGAYVAAAAYNACDRHVSRKYPQRRRLKNGLRYLLTHRPGFALWQTAAGAWVAGLHEWRAGSAHLEGEFAREDAGGCLQQLREDARVFARGRDAKADLGDRQNAYELLSAVFSWTAEPVELDLLTGVVAEWWGVTDETVEVGGEGVERDGEEARGVQLADTRPEPSAEAERRAYLERLWREIVELPPRQRAALLLNLRDEQGRACVDLWTLTGVATARGVAEVLEMTLEDFAAIWSELPLDDKRIAALLNLTRQQVINLRKSARERLTRRMKDF